MRRTLLSPSLSLFLSLSLSLSLTKEQKATMIINMPDLIEMGVVSVEDATQ